VSPSSGGSEGTEVAARGASFRSAFWCVLAAAGRANVAGGGGNQLRLGALAAATRPDGALTGGGLPSKGLVLGQRSRVSLLGTTMGTSC
jgi:hypothetical protein